MKSGISLGLAAVSAVSIALCCGEALAGRELSRNPPSACSGPGNKCGCPEKKVTAKCIKATVDMGETTPWTGSLECSLKIFADDDSPSIFTADSLYAVLGGYTFKRLGTQNLADGATPAEVVFSHPNGEPVHFVFAEGESLGRPDPGVHIKMDERLMMVDAEGWAATHDPVYYDLYIGDGSRRRFLATNMTGALGQLVSITDARGVTTTPTEMGVDIVYDSNGVRQYLTPSRLANVTHTAGFTGYDVTVYALQEAPAKDAQTGLYAVPAAQPVERLSVRRENDGKRAVVTVQKGGGEALRYVFDYAMGEWSLTRPSGAQELRERHIADEREAKIVTSYVSSHGERLEHTEYNYKWESWGFAMTNKVEGFDGVTDTTEWTYYTSGNGKGQIKTEKRQSGLLIQYTYDNVDRVISETRSGPGMMTEMTTYDYTPVDPSDPVLPVDTRPRTVVKKLNNIECERTYYVYSPLTNIVERVGTQGAAYGGTNALRTVTTFYPVTVGASVLTRPQAGFVASIRHEDGKLDLYDYELASNTWIRTVTHLHEQSPSPISGKTTRDITVTNARGEEIEARTEAFIDGIWYTIARDRMTYNLQGKCITSENLAGQVTTTAWDCCHKVSETGPDGSTTTWDYDDDGRIIASSRLIPLDMTNVTWLTTCYRYDALGRQTATWQTNYAAQVGLPVTRTRYDQLGRVIARVDQLGNTTTTEYSPDGRTVFVRNLNTSTVTYSRNASGDTLSITGTAVTPEFHTYGILSDGTRWSRAVQGETASSPRFTKRYENLLGQTIREERSGFQGSVLAATHTYDALGRLVSIVADYEPTTEYTYDARGVRSASVRHADGQWRKTETLSSFIIEDSIVWLTQTNIVSCSDSAIAPLVTSSAQQLTGLSAATPARSRSTDIRGNVTENEMLIDSSFVTSRQTLPYATNKPLALSRYGVSLMDVSVSAVTNTVAYDFLGRTIAHTDGRGNTRHTEYNSHGQRSANIDAIGNRTTYAYDQFGNIASVTDPLGNATVYEYDLRGRKTYEGGATYPVRYTYDIFGNKTTMMTYRDVGGSQSSAAAPQGDVTTWLYDIASGSMTNKVYVDGKGPSYSYTPDGKLSRRTWARGIVTDYSYDNWGSLTNTVYSDNTPTVFLTYDALGRQISVHDAAGLTAFLYDSFGSLTSETVVGVAGTNSIDRFYDNFGRDTGYALNGVRQSTLGYDSATARLLSMQISRTGGSPVQDEATFSWSYLPGSDLKSSLSYPNGLAASWTYDANNQLLQVCNATPTNVISQYDYTYDAAGRRVSCAKSGSAFAHDDIVDYGYNARSELTNAVAAVDSNYRYSYAFDDIGNRETSSERGTNSVYTANQLNQYTEISDSALSASPRETFTPQFDDDGNQTRIKTATGIWSVTYNGENRPILWENISTNSPTPNSSTPTLISMSYDRIGRRVTKNAQRFVYDGYLQIANFELQTSDIKHHTFIWDPTEPIATRPLVWNHSALNSPHSALLFYTHDGNKNVSEAMDAFGDVSAHYDYAPFGAVTVALGDSANANVWRFSSEFAEDGLRLVYYNYRHYEPVIGRWLSRDFVDEKGFLDSTYAGAQFKKIETNFDNKTTLTVYSSFCYLFVMNRHVWVDVLGLAGKYDPPPPYLPEGLPCCPLDKADCERLCKPYPGYSRSICDKNWILGYRCRCICKWNLILVTKSGFPGYTRDVDCTYASPYIAIRQRTVGYYAMPVWWHCPSSIELGCGK
jgi:RHS repeat-associated protein